tara:strand:+ start:595 stop:936 length:342 start_codon:yes stop_codon:yes gene_type:complete
MTATRLETWAMPGVPDVLLCDEDGNFHFVELKATAGKAVELRPHQVAWLSKHSHASVWVLVLKKKTKTLPQKVLLYPGNTAMDLKLEGMAVEPLFEAEGDPDWENILGLISPR